MKNLLIFLGLLLLSAVRPATNQLKPDKEMETLPDVTLTILYDNYNFDEDFKCNWGFSCLVEGPEQTILFDTGDKDGNLMHNFKAAGKDPGDVDIIVLSHIHGDHTGGLPEFLESRSGIDVYVPASFPDKFKQSIESMGARPVEVKAARKIIDHVWTTGEMGDKIIEQSLVIETPGGLVILTGCAHPGIDTIVKETMKERVDKVLLVMGGFHMLQASADAVKAIAVEFKEKNIKYMAPTHCSGDGTLSIFKDTFGDDFIQVGAGKVINTADL